MASAVVAFFAAVTVAVMSVIMAVALMAFAVVIAGCIRIKYQRIIQKCLHLLIRISLYAREQLDSRRCQRISGAAADSAANQNIHAVSFQKARQASVSLTVGVYYRRRHDFSAFRLINFEFFAMSKVLKYLFIFVSDCNFHRNILSSCSIFPNPGIPHNFRLR